MADESRRGYTPEAFKHWLDDDRDGCSTRAEVLITEAVEPPPTPGACCALSGGSWFSCYDARTVRSASGMDVDHLVPLAEAWDSGAHACSAARRQAFANDLDAEYTLVAVSGRSMRAKADQEISQWLPPAGDVHCRYAADWVATKLRRQLALDEAEHQALFDLAQNCSDRRSPTKSRHDPAALVIAGRGGPVPVRTAGPGPPRRRPTAP
ncbi:HNH endonuclease [Streptomyces sp. NPDC000229]|uniref:HNH endonuclease n=1 Tax=Streptomyces sp. NPDC000229 TaxID=3154247 RepID=UPI00331DE3B1